MKKIYLNLVILSICGCSLNSKTSNSFNFYCSKNSSDVIVRAYLPKGKPAKKAEITVYDDASRIVLQKS